MGRFCVLRVYLLDFFDLCLLCHASESIYSAFTHILVNWILANSYRIQPGDHLRLWIVSFSGRGIRCTESLMPKRMRSKLSNSVKEIWLLVRNIMNRLDDDYPATPQVSILSHHRRGSHIDRRWPQYMDYRWRDVSSHMSGMQSHSSV